MGYKTERLKRTNIIKAILHKTTINCSYCPTLQDKGGGGGELQDREAKKDQHRQGHVTQPTDNSNYCYTFMGGGGGGGLQELKTERLKRTNISRGILHKTTINCSYCPTLQDKGGGGGEGGNCKTERLKRTNIGRAILYKLQSTPATVPHLGHGGWGGPYNREGMKCCYCWQGQTNWTPQQGFCPIDLTHTRSSTIHVCTWIFLVRVRSLRFCFVFWAVTRQRPWTTTFEEKELKLNWTKVLLTRLKPSHQTKLAHLQYCFTWDPL